MDEFFVKRPSILVFLMFMQVALRLYISGKNDTRMMLCSHPKIHKFQKNMNFKQKSTELYLCHVKYMLRLFYYCLKCWFHNHIASQPENTARGQLMFEALSSSCRFFLEYLSSLRLSGTALTRFSFLVSEELFPVHFGLFAPPPPHVYMVVMGVNTANVL